MARPAGERINHHTLRFVREVRGRSASWVAVQAECSAGTYSDVENGKQRPSLELLHRIAAALEVPPLALMTQLPSHEIRDTDEVAA